MASTATQFDTPHAAGRWQINVGSAERNLSLLGGGLLLLSGLRRGGFGGIVRSLLGGSLLYRGSTGYCPLYSSLGLSTAQPQGLTKAGAMGLSLPKAMEVHLESAITIARPADELYRYWRRQENLPNFMLYIESVTAKDDIYSHWVAKMPLDRRLEWDSEITADRPGELIAWRSLEGADLDQRGEVRFQAAPGQRGTEVRLKMDMIPSGGLLGAAARFLKGLPEQMLHEDLRRFKQLMETGEMPTITDQPSGRV